MATTTRSPIQEAARTRVMGFARDERGNLTILMGLAIMAVVLASGIAVDTARLLNAKTALAAAADAAALQVGNAQNKTQAQIEAMALDVIQRNFDEDKHGPLDDVTLTVNNSRVNLTARADFETSFMRLAGIETISLPVATEVIKSGNNLETALILDVTGSMRGNKLRALKEAATDFVNTVVWDNQGQFTSKVALIPYASGVNVGSRAAAARGSVSSGTCTTPGCQSYRFRNMNRNNRTLNISNCVSERTGAQAFTDLPAAAAPVGRSYDSPNNPCIDSEILPLSRNRATILAAIDDLSAEGSTAGQVGIAWGWYALSRDFGMWTGDSTPAAYGERRVSKIAVIMTDGAFNTARCNGVVARNSGNGSGNSDDKINCDATNGSSRQQAEQLCTAMKARGITIYTIGFDVEDDEDAQDVMRDCASGAGNAYLAATAGELQAAFADIGRRVTALRISK